MLVAVVAAFAPGESAVTHFVGVWDAARWLLGASGFLACLSALPATGTRTWLVGAAVVSAAVGLAAGIGRDLWLHRTPLHGGFDALFGIPAELGFVALAAGLSCAGRSLVGAPRAVCVAGLLWATCALVAPGNLYGVSSSALELATGHLSGPSWPAGIAILLAALGVLSGWLAVALPDRRALVITSLVCLAFATLAYPLGTSTGPTGIMTGLLVATGLILAACLGRELLSTPPLPPNERAVVIRASRELPAFLIIGIFVALKLLTLGPTSTDENIYFYMAQDLATGRWPYVDYFFAHPPLHVVLPGAATTVLDLSLTTLKLISVAATAVTGCAVWLLARPRLSAVGGALALVAFLFAAETLKASTNMTGVNLTTMWLMLGLLASYSGHALRAGVLFGLAATTGFYAMAAICAALLLGMFRPPTSPDASGWARVSWGLRQLAGFVVVAGGINLLFYIAAGDVFIEGVYTYHGLKPLQDPAMLPPFEGFPGSVIHNIDVMLDGRAFRRDFYYHPHLWTSFALVPLVVLAAFFSSEGALERWRALLSPGRLFTSGDATRSGADHLAGWTFLVALALFIQYALFRELHSFYWTLIHPCLAILTSYVVVRVATLLIDNLPDGERSSSRWIIVGLTAVLALLFVRHVGQGHRAVLIFEDELMRLGSRNDYTLPDAGPAVSQDIGHAYFWDDHRFRGADASGHDHFLWNKTRRFGTLDEIAAFIQAESKPEDTITGASTVAPLVAMAAERRLAAGEVDTNSKRFRSGLLDEATFWTAVCNDNLRFVVTLPNSYFTQRRMQSDATARRWFRLRETFIDRQLKYRRPVPIHIYEAIGGAPGGAACAYEPR